MRSDLVRKLNNEAEALGRSLPGQPLLGSLLDGSIDRDGYALFLTQTFHYVRWTAPLLSRSAARLRASGGSSRLCALLDQKAGEESGHDAWALSDLAALSVTAEEVRASSPAAAVLAYVTWNRFHAEEGSPFAILGTAYVLEHLAAHGAGGVAERLERGGRIPNIRKATRFLRGHGALDAGHLAELGSALGEVTGAPHQRAVRLSAEALRALYGQFFTPPTAPAEESATSLPGRAGRAGCGCSHPACRRHARCAA